MFNHTTTKIAVTCAVAAMFMAHPMWALNNRSWVVSFGSDQNNCTALFPCRTFQHAHDVTNPGGEVDVLDPGDYGTLTVNKPITIDGGNMGYIQVSVAASSGIEIAAPVNATVIVRNLSISGLPQAVNGLGVSWLSGQSLFVEGVSVHGLSYGLYVDVVPTSTDFGAPQLSVKDVTIRNCSHSGIIIVSVAKAEVVVNRATIENVGNGVELHGPKASIAHSLISHASESGVVTDGEINLEDSSIVYSAYGLGVGGPGAIGRIAGDNFHDNGVALYPYGGGQIVSFGNNRILGNASGETPSSTVGLK